ncbi:MAG: hypothetical protein KDA99_07595, partial [Planctomycetales bacterium]|nr:hypothetical protein [Planctomycetales bacterium]
ARRTDPPAVFYGHHDRPLSADAQQVLPIPPQWLIEALGLINLDPQHGQISGPYPHSDGRLEIRYVVAGPDGPWTKQLIVDGKYGWVVQQHVFDASMRNLASVWASQHRHDPSHGVTLPRQVVIRLPSTQINTITLRMDSISVNQLQADPVQLWTMPEYDGYPPTHLSEVQLLPQ